MRRIERRRLEGLVEAVDVDQHVLAAGRLAEQLVDPRHRLDRLEMPIIEPDRGQREFSLGRRHELCARDRHRRGPLRPEPRPRARIVHRLARGRDQQHRVGGKLRSVADARRAQAGRAAAQRQRVSGQRAQQRAP